MYNARFTFVLKDVVVRPTTPEFEIGEVTIDVMQECNDEQVIVKLQENSLELLKAVKVYA